MKWRRVMCVVLALSAESVCLAWNGVAEFECAATNALDSSSVLSSAAFMSEVTNYVANVTDHEAEMGARLVLGECLIANFTETLDDKNLDEALKVATNVCAITHCETNKWYCWQSKLLVFACHAQKDDMTAAYATASAALTELGQREVDDSSVLSAALLKRNKAEGLTIRQAVVLTKAMSAAMLKHNSEAVALSASLPAKYQTMITSILNSN